MSFCKHRVMDKCKKDGKLCIYSKECFEPEEQKPITNADHIRFMTDEELAETIVREFCAVSDNTVEFIVAKTRFRLWLKQPYKEEV